MGKGEHWIGKRGGGRERRHGHPELSGFVRSINMGSQELLTTPGKRKEKGIRGVYASTRG